MKKVYVLICVVCVLILSGSCFFWYKDIEEDGIQRQPSGNVQKDEKISEGIKMEKIWDLQGKKVTIGDWFTKPISIETEYQKETQKYRKKIMKRNNFSITRKIVGEWEDIPEMILSFNEKNDFGIDIFCVYQSHILNLLRQDALYDLSTLENINFEEEKWNKEINELMSIQDRVFGMQIDQEPRGGIFFNKRLFREAGINEDEPYRLQREGKWTWDIFEEYCKRLTKDNDNDGIPEQYALAGAAKDYYKLFSASNGIPFIGRINGKFTYMLNDSRWLQAMHECQKLIDCNYVMQPSSVSHGWDWYMFSFINGQAAMQIGEVYQAEILSNRMADDYGFVMMPAGPSGSMATCPLDNVLVIPSCVSKTEAEKIAFAFDLYTEDTPGYNTDADWKDKYFSFFCDKESVEETISYMRQEKYQIYDYAEFLNGVDYEKFSSDLFTQKEDIELQEEKIREKWKKVIEETNVFYG